MSGISYYVAGPLFQRVPTWVEVTKSIDKGNLTDADRMLTIYVKAHPKDSRAKIQQAQVKFKQNEWSAGERILETIKPDDENSLAALNLLGESSIRRKDAPSAERYFQTLTERLPRGLPPRQRLIFLYSMQLRTAEARKILWQLYEIEKNPKQLVDMTQVLFQVENDVRGFGDDLDQWYKTSPDNPFIRRAMGLSLHWRGRASEALPHLEAAAANLENDLTGRFALAECKLALGLLSNDESVEAILGRKPSQAADQVQWLLMSSRLLEARGNDDAAIKMLQEATKTLQQSREPHARLAQALLRRGKTLEAKQELAMADAAEARERSLKRAINDTRRDGLNTESCERIGTLCLDLGWQPEARAWLELALQYEPNRATARGLMARLPATSRDDSLAIALANPKLRNQKGQPPEVVSKPAVVTTSELKFIDIASRAQVNFQYNAAPTGDLFIVDTMGGGVGLIDYNHDGWLDLYFVNGCRLPYDFSAPPRPNKLFRNRKDGTFEDVTERAGVGGLGYGMGCSVADFDADGDDDLFVTGFGASLLYRNNGDGTFNDVTIDAGVATTRWSTASGFADLDGDGDLDLMAVTYVDAIKDKGPPCRDNTGRPIHCSPGYYPEQFNQLFRNNGNGTFTDVSKLAGIELPRGRGLGLAIADFDEDGRLDMFVANDASPNYFFRNLGNLKFEEIGISAGVGVDGAGQATASMGVVADDLDGDGRIDLFHTNFLNEPNTLRLNAGHGIFRDATLGANLDASSRALTGFGTVGADFNHDGWVDLFVTNGHVDDQSWVNSPMAQPPRLYLNKGQAKFAQAGPEASEYLSRRVVGRGLASGDFDNDGRVDLVVVHRDVPVAILQNETRSANHWVGFKLIGNRSSRLPVGAKVAVTSGGITATRWVTSGTSYLSSNDPRIVLGLGKATKIDRLEVSWPSGTKQVWTSVPIDRYLDINEGRDALTNPLR
jgi:tetratricopeptide (TPR) repeat protein